MHRGERGVTVVRYSYTSPPVDPTTKRFIVNSMKRIDTKIISMYKSGSSLQEIGIVVNRSHWTIKRRLKNLGVWIKKKRKFNLKSRIRNSKEYHLWRKSILNKFNHTCSFCGAKERLELDHIEPVSKRPDLIMTDENARILCNPCHKTTDSYPKSLAIGHKES